VRSRSWWSAFSNALPAYIASAASHSSFDSSTGRSPQFLQSA
jgi:hypothetical protein